MSRQISTLRLGLFVTVGIIIGASVIVWVGASRYFEKGSMYLTYFDESVQGLQEDSIVKYRGVDVGRIVSIGVAPDNRLIEVVMKIDLSDDLEHNTMAQLKAVGLTGIVFIELDRRDAVVSDISPRINFAAKYPIIPSKPSEVRQILLGIDKVIDKVNKVDFQGISDQIKATAKSADNLLAGSKMEKVMSNLESSTMAFDKSMARLEKVISSGDVESSLTEARQTLASARSFLSELKQQVIDMVNKVDFQGISDQIKTTAKSADKILAGSKLEKVMSNLESSTMAFDKSMARLEKIMSEGSLEGTVAEARQSMAELRSLVAVLEKEAKSMKLSDTAEKANQVINSLAKNSGESALNIKMATENLRNALESLERLMERLETNPSDLIFSR